MPLKLKVICDVVVPIPFSSTFLSITNTNTQPYKGSEYRPVNVLTSPCYPNHLMIIVCIEKKSLKCKKNSHF